MQIEIILITGEEIPEDVYDHMLKNNKAPLLLLSSGSLVDNIRADMETEEEISALFIQKFNEKILA